MAQVKKVPRGLFDLPNEILLTVFNRFSVPDLVQFMTISRHIHSLILRLLHHRLQIAAGLAGYTLYVECFHPSAQWTPTATKLFCVPIGGERLSDPSLDDQEVVDCVGAGKKIAAHYSRFRPQGNEPTYKKRRESTRRPGDIPGSRTYSLYQDSEEGTLTGDDEAVCDTVTIDSHDLFSQLMTLSYIGQRDPGTGLLFKVQDIGEGTIRVWRDWLSQRCEKKTWTDGDPIAIHHDSADTSDDKANSNRDNTVEKINPTKDCKVLWANTRDYNVGIKFRVKERKWDKDDPLINSNDVDAAVSYVVEFEEVFVKTTHLLLELEKAEAMITNQSERAIVFGSFAAGNIQVETAGGQLRYEP
ncbi:Hypothetical protein R9X50_00215000 [Acrodontium crateriforme]|uniref:F-box domain-containing protein n=1 Tax=Acrodontium crateriforme TaxID=150365 RepID=A0AAQ3M0A7_9PEZI|nr:Hypothetical protein R9X50_00215000 [Acrodontium crateriforme]